MKLQAKCLCGKCEIELNKDVCPECKKNLLVEEHAEDCLIAAENRASDDACARIDEARGK